MNSCSTCSSEQNYQNVYQLSKEAQLLGSISQLLSWDQETYMPPEGDEIRGKQMQILAGLIHQKKTNPSFAEALGKLIDLPSGKLIVNDLSVPQQAALREWRHDYIRDTALPADFVETFTLLTTRAHSVWKEARQNDDFLVFAPVLEQIIEMCKRKAEYLKYDEHPYDALLDLYEPGMKTCELSVLFSSLREGLSPLLKKISQAKQVDDHFLKIELDHTKQIEFGKTILNHMGFTLTRGRLDISTHPFSSSLHPTDCRITTRFSHNSFLNCLLGILHEAGHALYEMGLPIETYGSPLSEPISYGIHESQSRWWETLVGLSKPFWKHYLPLLQQSFSGSLDDVNLDLFYKGINKVEPSLIRVNADEVSYPLHIILRYELEIALIEGKLSVKEIPEAWNQKMETIIGIKPANDREGCLQDIHWSMGAFGYFPSYALGNAYASHLFTAFATKFPDWETLVAKGDLLCMKNWLNEEVHRYGRQYSNLELMKKITGKPFSVEAYIDYLNDKYCTIYELT